MGMLAKVVQNDAKSFCWLLYRYNTNRMTDFQMFANSSDDNLRDDRPY